MTSQNSNSMLFCLVIIKIKDILNLSLLVPISVPTTAQFTSDIHQRNLMVDDK